MMNVEIIRHRGVASRPPVRKTYKSKP